MASYIVLEGGVYAEFCSSCTIITTRVNPPFESEDLKFFIWLCYMF